MFTAKEDFKISPNGWDILSFKKGDAIPEELQERCIELGLAVKKRAPKKSKPNAGPDFLKSEADETDE